MLARAALVLVAFATACDPKPSDEHEESDDHHASESEAESSDSEDAGCAAETRDDTYMLGLEKSGAHVTVRFVDAMPSPPARFDNTWMLEVVDSATNMPMTEFELEVEPYMPDHMHGTSIACDVTPMPEPGQVQLEPVNLFMPGMWEVRLNFSLTDGPNGELEDQVVFRFCVDP